MLTAINGSPLMRSSDFAGIISKMASGTTVYLAYRHGERTTVAIAERQKFSALLKMLRAGLT